MKNKKLLIVIVGTIFALLVIVALSLTGKPNDESEDETRLTRALQSIPYSNAKFSVDYIYDSGRFSVQILADPIEENKQLAVKYLKSLGLKDEDIKVDYFVVPAISGQPGP